MGQGGSKEQVNATPFDFLLLRRPKEVTRSACHAHAGDLNFLLDQGLPTPLFGVLTSPRHRRRTNFVPLRLFAALEAKSTWRGAGRALLTFTSSDELSSTQFDKRAIVSLGRTARVNFVPN